MKAHIAYTSMYIQWTVCTRERAPVPKVLSQSMLVSIFMTSSPGSWKPSLPHNPVLHDFADPFSVKDIGLVGLAALRGGCSSGQLACNID